MQAGRLFELLYLLIERDNWTVNALSKRLEVSERTVRRDLDGLSAVGVPVYTVQGRGGGVRLLPGFVLDRSLLSAKEQDEILYGLQALRATGLQPNQTLLRQLSSLFGRRQDYDWLEADFSEWGSGGCSRERFELLKRGILERHPLNFLYYAADQRAAWRTVEPVRLCFKGISWYVQAWCRTRQAFRTFKLSRMEQVQLCEQQTFFPHDMPPALGRQLDTMQLQQVVIRFAPQAAFRVYDEFERGQITRQSDGWLLVRTKWQIDAWCGSYLLSYGSLAQVLEPHTLREWIAQEARKICLQIEQNK